MSKLQRYNELHSFFIFIKRYWLYEGLMLILIILGTACSLALPYVLGKIIDEVIPSADQTLLLELVLIIVAINIIRFIVGMVSEYLSTWLSGQIIKDIKEKLFCNLLKMPFPYFEKNKPGQVIQVISHEVDKIKHFLTTSVIRLLNNLFTLLSSAIMLCYLNYKLFFISLSILPIVIFINAKTSKHVRDLVKITGIKEGELYNFYFERIKNISLIKLFNTWEYEQLQLTAKAKNLILLYLKNRKFTALGSNGSFFFISLSPLIILLVGGYHVINQMMTIGALVAFIQYSNRLIAPANDFLSLYIDYVKARESAKRIFPYLHPAEIEENNRLSEVGIDNVWELTCSNLCFSVDKTQILSNVNMEFTRGHSYGIVGANGAGKTTLIKIIAKLYKPTAGHIKINNKYSLNTISENEWYKHITVISQHAQILHESIRDNLIYANRNASENELWNSLEAVNLKAYVQSLPRGLDTLIGDGDECANPSGGQIQKLSLARSLLKQADIIILDEVTSAMDNYSSKEILSLILKIFSDKIIICITHDYADTVLFDQVYLLEDGALVEFGKHTDLLMSNGKYKALFKHQLTAAANKNDVL